MYELKKVLFIFLFVLSIIGTIVFFGAIFSYIIHSFLSVILTEWLPLIIPTISKFLFHLSPLIIFFRLIFLLLCFFIFTYKNDPSKMNILTLIIYLILIIFNLIILMIYFLINYFNILLLLLIIIIVIIKYFYLQIPTNFLNQLQDQINFFFCHSFNQ